MIQYLDITQRSVAKKVLDVQIPSYQVEAEIIGFNGIPQLNDSVESLMTSSEIFYGYFVDTSLAGAIAFVLEDNVLDIHRLIVHPNYFRKGIGESLVQYILNLDTAVKKYIVRTGTKNIPAKNLYKKFGFIEKEDEEVAPNVFLTIFESDRLTL
ncbi:GNAT family N-acetyltransferase [Metabacillus sediminilitoris]|uniref:GNAT family N-acetyltransferase n=1 Tax=Metabacillus sediminilitoris TaxID=2567941 RepID=A0A4S4BI74_9BACI|nr:GNAT family N-acetyltransferase [Metabacillus sediminilitoris]QGQ45769.1 GNAT family N-acetyltransferase [Metabacillus sediminilitoris]THF74184.1 GNAT family N-acetyltransferase [Metabacillus sediminilitoris]